MTDEISPNDDSYFYHCIKAFLPLAQTSQVRENPLLRSRVYYESMIKIRLWINDQNKIATLACLNWNIAQEHFFKAKNQ